MNLTQTRRHRLLLLGGVLVIGVLTAAGLRARGRRAEAARLVQLMELGTGSKVADVGAGNGWLTVEIAEQVGTSGHVYATEPSASRRRAITRAIERAGLTNVTVIEAGEHVTNLPPTCCDAVVLRRVYHHLTDTRSINRSLYEAVEPGGLLAIIEFDAGGWLGRVTHMGMERNVLTEDVTRAGFELIALRDWPVWEHYVALFRKPPVRGER